MGGQPFKKWRTHCPANAWFRCRWWQRHCSHCRPLTGRCGVVVNSKILATWARKLAPLGEGQKWCAHYYGKHGGKDGWANWEESNCTFPFNDICMLVKGDAELTDHQFETRYLRSCYFRCPCNESIPWELHGIGGSLAEATNFTWNKKCSMIPPTSYALSSPNYPWPSHKVVDIYCCKKYHYPSVPADRRWLYADRGEACNMWEIDPAVRPKADATLCAALIGLVLLYLSKQPS